MDDLPDDIRFLMLLHNVGAISPERGLSIMEISRWTATKNEIVKKKLSELTSKRYVDVFFSGDQEKYYVTVKGIRKVLSTYS
ncbi:hypothetical protein J7L00_06190 [Candidatus Bathyarchaeota archaeon]|nr:hypothetical protein [Candidatus Bathyarchaeota archaeon]